MLLPNRIVLAFFLVVSTAAVAAERQTLSLRVDATDIRRKLIHAELQVPVKPGNITLVYPKWIPGNHSPSGPLNNVVWMKFSAGEHMVSWTRDPVDMFAFHIRVPDGTQTLNVALDSVLPARPHGSSATPSLFLLGWNKVLLYPQGISSDDIDVQAEIRLPKGWKYACALPGTALSNDIVKFPPVSLTTLVDSPLLSGEHFRTFSLDDGPIPVAMSVAADSEEALHLSPELHEQFKGVVRQTDLLFGARHYDHYTFLLSLSDEVGEDGTEHHQSTDITLKDGVFQDKSERLASIYLIPHEYVHSWNGKYRRPEGLNTKNFQDPMRGELLWVYEGLTRYLNWVLAARSGMFTPEAARDYVAVIAAVMEHRSGRQWRTLEDTARSVQLLYGSGEWESLRRTTDYYDESLLLWLEVDQIIRSKTSVQKSLDDFCRAEYRSSNHRGAFLDRSFAPFQLRNH
jgi:predicted metalloprotease with PDZ domain